MTTSPRWRIALASAASAAVIVAAPLVGAQTAHAQPPSPTCFAYPPVPPLLTLDRTSVPAGGTVTFSANCFAPLERIVVDVHSREVVLGRFRADAKGGVTGKVTIPRRAKLGYHTFRLKGRKSGLELSVRIKVLRAKHVQGHRGPEQSGWSDGRGNSHHGSTLAATGSERALAVSGIAAGLVAAGGGTMLAVRRRRSS
ncbi:hypothetical protein [Streptomyces mirabilis]|uniref:hypothetical protein n=1 Tax=Streptomyces mirabilis TaxID=68239 RepID=UPI00368A0C0D